MADSHDWRSSLTASDRYENIQNMLASILRMIRINNPLGIAILMISGGLAKQLSPQPG